MIYRFFITVFVLLSLQSNGQKVYNIKDFGAVGDGNTMNTVAIQTAIDKCSKTGGQVLIPEGIFMSGTIQLKSKVEIHIEKNGILKGSPVFKDYPMNNVTYPNAFNLKFNGDISLSRALIFAEGEHDIALTGEGSINGNGDASAFNLGNDGASQKSRQRPCMMLIVNCRNIKVYDLFLTNSAYWLENYIGCESLHIKGVTIYNHTNYNQDGMDIDAKNVLIENCKIDVDDDGICFKNHERKHIVENVVVRNCTIASNCNAIKFGTVTMGGLKNVSVFNCTIKAASEDKIRHWQQNVPFIELPITALSGLAIESVDGAIVDGVRFSDITMQDVQTPIFVVLGNRSYKPVGDSIYRAGQIKNLVFKNIKATSHSKMASSITAYPGTYVKNILLENIVLDNMGKGTDKDAEIAFPENPKAYPENRMYGAVYPASGFYIRHAKNIQLKNIQLSVRNQDARPSIVMEDMHNITISNLQAPTSSGNSATIKVIKSNDITINNPIVHQKNKPFVELISTKRRELIVNGLNPYNGWIINNK